MQFSHPVNENPRSAKLASGADTGDKEENGDTHTHTQVTRYGRGGERTGAHLAPRANELEVEVEPLGHFLGVVGEDDVLVSLQPVLAAKRQTQQRAGGRESERR